MGTNSRPATSRNHRILTPRQCGNECAEIGIARDEDIHGEEQPRRARRSVLYEAFPFRFEAQMVAEMERSTLRVLAAFAVQSRLIGTPTISPTPGSGCRASRADADQNRA